jgi:hypothetical protein
MQCVFHANHSLEARMVADLLAQQDLEPTVEGEMLEIATGEVPAIGLVRVLVPDRQSERAEAIVRDFEISRSGSSAPAPAHHPLIHTVDWFIHTLTKALHDISTRR